MGDIKGRVNFFCVTAPPPPQAEKILCTALARTRSRPKVSFTYYYQICMVFAKIDNIL